MASPPGSDPPWRPRTAPRWASRRRPRCPTLAELATQAVVANIDMCVMASRELWMRLPRRILLDIYSRLLYPERTLEVWSLISTTLFARREPVSGNIYHSTARISPPSPGRPLDPKSFTRCFGPAWSPGTSFITHLTLDSTCQLDTPLLVLLPDMPNLGLLRIVEPRETLAEHPRITDRVIRSWTERENPFPALRILQLSCCLELTPECLRYLAPFPSLVYVTVRAPRTKWGRAGAHATAPKHGWRVPESPDDVQALMRRYFASCLGLRDGLPRRCALAARLVSAGKPADLTRLFQEASTVEFKERPDVLPWDGRVPSSAADVTDEESAEDAELEEMRRELPEGAMTVHDNPAWWLYAAIGHVLLRDRDLEPTGPAAAAADRDVPILNGWVLPPRPVLSLTMAPEQPSDAYLGGTWGQGPAGKNKLDKYVFVREAAFRDVASRETAWVLEKAPPPEKKDAGRGAGTARARTGEVSLRQRKRRKMGDVLSSMAGG